MSYFTRIWQALLGREAPAPPGADPELRARLASLQMDLRERDQRIAAMQKEYATLEAGGKRTAAAAGQDQLLALFTKLAPPLSNLAALAALAQAGKDVTVVDMAALLASLDQRLKAAGLEQIGSTGETAAFDVALHQRMSGGTVSPGSAVMVRTPGYRFGGKVLLKAMVTAQEAAHE